MADNPRTPQGDTSETERDRSYDEPTKGRSESEESIVNEDLGDVDPDSASADVDRDDSVEDI